MLRRNKHGLVAAAFAAALASFVASVGLTSGVAHADLPSHFTFDLAATGSDTAITPVMDAIANIATPGLQGTSNLFDSFDPTGTAKINTTDPFTPSGVDCTSQVRPNSDSAALQALVGTLTGATPECFQFATSSRGSVSGDPTGLTWIPFAQDIIDFAVTNTSNIPRTLTLAELQLFYTCDPLVVGTGLGGPVSQNGFLRNPVLPQSGSASRLFWESLIGIIDSAVGSGTFGSGSLGCIVNGVNPTDPSQAWPENNATLLNDAELEPFSVAQYEIQGDGLATDLRGRALLGNLQNTDGSIWQPQVLNAPGSQTSVAVPSEFERAMYNVVPTNDFTGPAGLSAEIQQVFVGPNSDFCSPTALGGAIRATILRYHLRPDPNCGSTTAQGLVAAGAYHTCTLLTDGTVDCWGDNQFGELGDGTSTDSSTPVQVLGVGDSGLLAGVTQITLGGDHTCALITGGTVDCWGWNGYGQLGNGTTTNSSTPVQVLGVGGNGLLSGVTQLAAGGDHNCALLSGGAVDCWGDNQFGELGNATIAYSSTPVQVVAVGDSGLLAGATQLTAGAEHSCALLSGGTVDCWGWNFAGQLGNGTDTNSSTPVQVLTLGGSGVLSGATQLASGDYHTCALLSAGAADCWGYNSAGQLGNGTTTYSSTPVQVLAVGGGGVLSGATQLAGGGLHTCALLSGGNVDCWAWNFYGQLGNGTNTNSSTPVQVLAVGGGGVLAGATQLAAGYDHTCALLSGDAVDCWGWNYFGQLGNSTYTSSSTPVEVIDLAGL